MDWLGWPARRKGRRFGLLASSSLLAGAVAMLTVMALPPRNALGQATPAPAARPQTVATSGQQDRLTQAQLEQLLAPIALYPDDLLMQMLMASTYPLEIVQAKRWLGQGQNASLRGDALTQALLAQSWDPSVKSLVPFPDVLNMMNEQLEWTQQVGDAVLAQQQDVMNSIQALRSRAQAAGTLQSGPQQTVTVTQNVNVPPPAPGAAAPAVAPPQQVITIAPTQPDTVYVPAYDPNVVYGSWPYPQSPPYYYPPPVGWGLGSALLTGMAFAGGAAIVGSLWGWGNANWGGGDINVNANRYNNINANRGQISGNTWRHDSSHRGGVAYSNNDVRNRFQGNRPGSGDDRAQARDQMRGRIDQAQRGEGIGGRQGGDRGGLGDRGSLGGQGGPGDRGGLGDRGGPGDRGGLGDRGGPGDRGGIGGGAGQRPGGGAGVQRPSGGGAAQRPAIGQSPSGRPQARPAQSPARQPQGFEGVGQGGRERAAAQRGSASRQGQVQARGGGGGARAGGGGGRGGGGGGRGGRR